MITFAIVAFAILILIYIIGIEYLTVKCFGGGVILPKNYKINLAHYKLNNFNSDIINNYEPLNSPFIATTIRSSIFFKYYIDDVGVVPRWTKAHRQIKQKFKELHNEYNRNARCPKPGNSTAANGKCKSFK